MLLQQFGWYCAITGIFHAFCAHLDRNSRNTHWSEKKDSNKSCIFNTFSVTFGDKGERRRQIICLCLSVYCSVLEIHFGIALNSGVLPGKEHMLTPCRALHRHLCAWVGAIRLDSGKDRGGHSWSVDCTVSWPFLNSCHSTAADLALNVLGADWTVAPPVYSFPRIITWCIRNVVSREPAAPVFRLQNVIWTFMFVRAHFGPLDSRSFGLHEQATGQQFQVSAILKNTVCRDVMPGSLLEFHCHVGGALYLPRKWRYRIPPQPW